MTRKTIAVLLVCAAPILAQNDTASTAKKKQAASAKRNPAQLTIPKGAVLDPRDGNYHYTDKQGKKWVYMMTPMGPSRWEEKQSPAPPASETSRRLSQDPNLKAIDQGDTVRFERTTPFGPQTWTKKKSELTDDERSMLSKPSAQPKDETGKPQN